MVTIPYTGLRPASFSMPQIPNALSVRPNYQAAQNAAEALSRFSRPQMSPDILGQVINGYQQTGQLMNLLSPPPDAMNVVAAPQTVTMPSMTIPGTTTDSGMPIRPATLGGGTMTFPAQQFSIAMPDIPQPGILERIYNGVFGQTGP